MPERGKMVEIQPLAFGEQMDEPRKYFGMTGPQLGILAGLAGALCLILCVSGWLIFGSGLNMARPQSIPSTVVNPTATRILTPTVTPTIAPTAIPYEQLIPQGWVQHRTALMELWLPSGYRKSDTRYPFLSYELTKVDLTLSRAPSDTSLYNVYVIVAYEPLPQDSLNSHLDDRVVEIPDGVRLVERRDVFVNSTPAVRLLFEGKSSDGLDVNALMYVFLDGNTVWYVEYFTQINEFYQLLEVFEKSIATFRLSK